MKAILFALALALPSPRPEEAPPPALPGPGSVPARSFGLATVDGALVGGGPGFGARFDPGGPGVWAAGGERLGLELVDVRRGGELVHVAEPHVAPREEGALCVYPRGTFTERYEVTREGVAQSFLFDEPAGTSGELVVRLRIDTTLERVEADATGALYAGADGRGVSIGGVTGIDADGARREGALRARGEHLELVLPADFVDAASWPLLLDPLYGPSFLLGDNTHGDRHPDVAYSGASKLFLVVWQRESLAGTNEIVGQRVDLEGNLVGGMEFFTTAGPYVEPAAGIVNALDRFVVAWRKEAIGGLLATRVEARTLSAMGSTFSPTITIVAAPPDSQLSDPDVGGEWNTTDGYALIVWRADDKSIDATRVRVFGAADLAAEPAFHVSSPGGLDTDTQPRVSSTNGQGGIWGVVWRRIVLNPFTGQFNYRVVGQAVDRPGVLLGSESSFAFSVEPIAEADVDGEAPRFLAAWDVANGSAGARRVMGVPLWGDASGLTSTGPPVELAGSGGLLDSYAPRVALGVGHAWVQYVVGSQLRAVGVHPEEATICEGALVLTDQYAEHDGHAIADTQAPGHFSPDRALSTWARDLHGSYLGAQLLTSLGPGGAVVDLGGACGNGGTLTLDPSDPFAIGHPDVWFRLDGADPGALFAIFNLNVAGPELACGSCVLTPPFLLSFEPIAGGVGREAARHPVRPGPGGSQRGRAVGGPFARHEPVLPVRRPVVLEPPALYGGGIIVSGDISGKGPQGLAAGASLTIQAARPPPRSQTTHPLRSPMRLDLNHLATAAAVLGMASAASAQSFPWNTLSPGSPPTARERVGSATDGTVIYVYGGQVTTTTSSFDNLLSFDGTSWSQLTASGNGAGPRSMPIMAWDTARGRLVVFAGMGANGVWGNLLQDTWEWDALNGWQQQGPATIPDERWAHERRLRARLRRRLSTAVARRPPVAPATSTTRRGSTTARTGA